MHILLLNEYYPPDTSATAKMAAQVAEALAQRHRVTVVAGRPSYDPDARYPYALLRRDTRNRVAVECVVSTAFPRHQMPRRVANYLSYLALAVPRALALRPDIILAMTDPPVAGIAGALIARLAGRPFVYNIRDLYPDMAVGGDIVRAGKWAARWESLHRRALKQAARVIVLGDDMRERILAKGVAAERVVVVRDGTMSATMPATAPATTPTTAPASTLPTTAAIPLANASATAAASANAPALSAAAAAAEVPDRGDPVVQEIRHGFPFVVLHAGNLGFYGAWDTLLGAAKILSNENTGFVFIGDGANRAALESAARDLPNVKFAPFRPVAQIAHVMMAGDVHIVTVKRGLEGVVVPSKLYSILAAGRPILVVAPAECDAARIVVESGCGVAADPDDPAAVAAAIRELRAQPERLGEMGHRARETAAKYARVNELERFVAIIESVAPAQPRK
jgi:glycosyltransferase involved in cell wall biosynthesis